MSYYNLIDTKGDSVEVQFCEINDALTDEDLSEIMLGRGIIDSSNFRVLNQNDRRRFLCDMFDLSYHTSEIELVKHVINWL